MSGLTCNTAYTFGVEAYDAAGNRSTRAMLTVTTAACTMTGNGLANLWVDLNGGTCTRAATAGAYVDAAACGTFDAAWDAATAGDVIRVKAGTYPAQTLSGAKSAATSIIGEAGVTVGKLSTTTATFLTLESMVFDSGSTQARSASSTRTTPRCATSRSGARS